VHPTRCGEFAEKGIESVVKQLEDLLQEGRRAGKVVAVGECGLDYDRLHFCDKEQQMVGFLQQLDIAAR
jgi:TatD DNase family protein